MHILTKIFIVLVALLAIFMVPLVVVSAKNQEHWKSEAMAFSQSHRLLSSQLQAERQNHQAELAQYAQELQDYSQRLAQLQASIADYDKQRLDSYYERNYKINELMGKEIIPEPCDPRGSAAVGPR